VTSTSGLLGRNNFRIARDTGVSAVDSHKPTYRDEFAPVGKISCALTLFGEERALMSASKTNGIDNSSMADRDPILTVDKNDQRHSSQMA
jgi:hypothetical protein